MAELSQVIGFMSVLEPVFTKPAFIACIRLVTGWILCPARRTITGIYPFAGPKRENRVDAYHYFFRAASWLQSELFACWARFLVGRLCAGRKPYTSPSTTPPTRKPDARWTERESAAAPSVPQPPNFKNPHTSQNVIPAE